MVFDLTFVLIHQSSYQIYVFINRFITTVKVPAKTFGHPVNEPLVYKQISIFLHFVQSVTDPRTDTLLYSCEDASKNVKLKAK